MAELLQYGRHEKQRRKAEQVAVSKDTNVYLETVETAKDAKTEADGVGNARMGSLWGSLQPKSLLENGKRRSGQTSTNKRKTDKLGLLWFSHSLSVHARQLLKRRVPSGMHGGVRGRRLVTASYSILIEY